MGAAALAAGTALSAAGGAYGAYANASAASARAAIDRGNADIARTTGNLAYAQAQQQGQRNIENRIGAGGASGVAGGSPLLADIDQFTQDQLRASMIRIKTEQQVMQDKTAADFEDMNARNAEIAGVFNVGTAVTMGMSRSGMATSPSTARAYGDPGEAAS